MKHILYVFFALTLSCGISSVVNAQIRWIVPSQNFQESGSTTVNPDRGLYKQLRFDNTFSFAVSPQEKNVRIYFVIDQFINKPFDQDQMTDFGNSLAAMERTHQRAIVRFLYDYPSADVVSSGLKSRNARTAPASLMSMHIRQLGSVLASHRRAVFAVESGLVGFWGEQHGDTPDKQTPSAIASVVDQWRVALAGTQIQILARYPKALQEHIAKQPDILAIQPKVGFWNDCLGAHDDVNMQVRQVPIVEGETCMLAPRIDYSCNTMMGYFQSIQLDELHSEYYRDIIAGWKMQGCFKQLEERLGYRYVIRKAKLADDGSEIMLQIDNVGWGRSLVSRPLYLVHDGHRVQQIGDLVDFYPGSVNHLHIHLNAPLPLSGGSITLETDDDVQFSNTTGNLIFHFN